MRSVEATVSLLGIEELIEQKIEEALARRHAREDDPWLTSAQTAEYLGVAVATIHDYVNGGKLPRHGARKTRLLFRRSDLDRYVETRGRL
jgi:excisionase family DNA binding protein